MTEKNSARRPDDYSTLCASPCETLAHVQPEGIRSHLRNVAGTLIRDGLSYEDVVREGRAVTVGKARVMFDTERQAQVHAFALVTAMLDVEARVILNVHAQRLGM